MVIDYGSDLSLGLDLKPDMAELDGDDRTLVAQSCMRRLQTPRGRLLYDGDYGIDLREYLRVDDSRLIHAPAKIIGELRKDDRVETVNADVNRDGDVVRFFVRVTTAVGPFSLTGTLSDDELLMEVVS